MEFHNITRIRSLYAMIRCVKRSFQAILKLKDLERSCLAALGNGKILKSDIRHFNVSDFILFHLAGNSQI